MGEGGAQLVFCVVFFVLGGGAEPDIGMEASGTHAALHQHSRDSEMQSLGEAGRLLVRQAGRPIVRQAGRRIVRQAATHTFSCVPPPPPHTHTTT